MDFRGPKILKLINFVFKFYRIKLKQIIQDVDGFCTRPRILSTIDNIFCYNMVKTLNQIHHQTQQYNKLFWCKIIFVVFMCFIVNVSVFSYVILFSKIDINLRVAAISVVLTEIFTFVAFLYSASNVNSLNIVVYNRMHSYYLASYVKPSLMVMTMIQKILDKKPIYFSPFNIGYKLKVSFVIIKC